MQQTGCIATEHGLEKHGIKNVDNVYWNLTTGALVEKALHRREGLLAHRGPLVVKTGHYTGRSPNDKFTVREPSSEKNIWWGKVNKAIDEEKFDDLHQRVLAFLEGSDLFVQDLYVGADPKYQTPIRIINTQAWHNLFARNMFVKPDWSKGVNNHIPEYTVLNASDFRAEPERDGTNSEAFIIAHFGKKMILIGGTSYAGETKKSIFTVMNYKLPLENVLSMHCSANMGKDGDVAIFFGLSGTGKTTLSADPERRLIGDDEHGWSDDGIFNYEGGCYAKVINLSEEKEPEIYKTTKMFGTILENVHIDINTRRIDLDDDSLTENTRGSYPVTHIDNCIYPGIGGHPKNIVMLTCDAFGVLPPISKMTPEQAMCHFLSGYTAKVAGTERGIKEPQATFSTCFGAPFMALHPTVYSKLLGKKIAKHKSACWLVNTGWSGGPYGVGKRMDITHTRALLNAALSGSLNDVPTVKDEVFGLHVPTSCPGVPTEVLQPINTWDNKSAFKEKAKDLAGRFEKNFKEFADMVSPEVRAASPKAG
ncbi:MAG: phosphoenolpyruvate carboxykinase [Nitrospinota bacterium]